MLFRTVFCRYCITTYINRYFLLNFMFLLVFWSTQNINKSAKILGQLLAQPLTLFPMGDIIQVSNTDRLQMANPMPILLLPKFCQECVRFDIWHGSIKVCFASVYIDISSHESLICWYHYQSVLNYVPRVPSCRTCPTCLCALHAYMLTCSRALRALHDCVPSCLYLSYLPSFFYVPDVPSYFTCLHFIDVYANKIHTN